MLDILALQLLEALIVVYKAGVTHCDMKPSNILMCFDTHGGFIIKLCDFGLSEITANSNRTGIKGTSGYVDPRVVID